MSQSCMAWPEPTPLNGRVISSFQSFLCDWTKLPSPLRQLWAELTLVSPLAFYHFCSPTPFFSYTTSGPLPVENHQIAWLLKLAFQFIFLANHIHLPFYLALQLRKALWNSLR